MQNKLPDIWKKSTWLTENYDILDPKPIGKGGFAEVYLVREKIDKQEYALKVQVAENDEDYKQAVQEVNTTLKMDHPNIIK
jgi:serine/threonine protein kinase